SGVGPVTAFDADGLASRIAGEVDDFDAEARFGKRGARRLDRFTQLALTATDEALRHAGLLAAATGAGGGAPGRQHDGDVTVTGIDADRAGVSYASGIGGIGTLLANHDTLREKGPKWVNPYLTPMMIANMAAGEIGLRHGLKGPNSCTVTACAASAHAIGDAAERIRWGRADVMVAGGAESSIVRLALAGFAAMTALSTRNDEPTRASRPFDTGRDGFVIAEGAATLVLEAEDHARARGAVPLAVVAGYGATGDAHHVTAPHPEGDGAVRCMAEALVDAELAPADIGYLNAHGTSTPPNDRIEALALRRVFGDDGPAVSSTKSMTGHLLGAAGAFEAWVCIEALARGVLPPTINLDDPDPDCAADHVATTARHQPIDAAMTNSFGFGGHNATLVLTRP
ncbi:MAG: beta-ketoacyl-ACP synthase II, partial [Acidimicrobiia bacterium]|nr:beta-ketoacyl-ACP synthase II [Acidimicrobiia bacterium]